MRKKGGILYRKSLLTVAVVALLFTVAASANADPNFEIQSLSSEFDRPGLHLALGQLDSNPGLHLALGHQNFSEPISAFSGKGGVMSGMSFSVISVPPDCRLDVGNSSVTGHAPEPATMLLLGTGLAGIAGLMRRRMKAKRR